MTHLYDDWNRRVNSNGEISKSIIGFTNCNDTINNVFSRYSEGLPKYLMLMMYMANSSEKKAFLSQAVQDLERLGCNNINYKEIYKQTTVYQNISKLYSGLEKILSEITDEELEYINKLIITTVKKCGKDTNYPYVSLEKYSPTAFKKKILDFMSDLYHYYMKKYMSIVYYYITEYNGGHILESAPSFHLYFDKLGMFNERYSFEDFKNNHFVIL
jgi:hypothetical protein